MRPEVVVTVPDLEAEVTDLDVLTRMARRLVGTIDG
jgi:hypothetical protein